MDQRKIGAFLRELRRENQLTQEQLAQRLGVTNRSVSRWENGSTMPDFDLVLELSQLFSVSLEELLAGQRQPDNPPAAQDTIRQVADYQSRDTAFLSRKLNRMFLWGLIAFVWYAVMDIAGDVNAPGWYEDLASAALGVVLGVLLVGFLYTSRYLSKVRAFQKRLWHGRQPAFPPGRKEEE